MRRSSIFGRPLEAVPNFVTWRGGYLDGINEFVKTIPATDCTDHATVPDSGKVTPEKVIFPPGDSAAAELPAGELCILRGKSPRGDHGHVVVARIDAGGAPSEMVWDPVRPFSCTRRRASPGASCPLCPRLTHATYDQPCLFCAMSSADEPLLPVTRPALLGAMTMRCVHNVARSTRTGHFSTTARPRDGRCCSGDPANPGLRTLEHRPKSLGNHR